MTVGSDKTIDFLVRIRKLDRVKFMMREILELWAIARQGGMSGQELAIKLGYKSRSNVQIGIKRLIQFGYIEDRRPQRDRMTPNDLWITPAGEDLLADIVPV